MTFRTIVRIVALTAVVVAVSPSRAQQVEKHDEASKAARDEDPRAVGHREVLDDPYIYVPREGRATSPGGRWVRDDYVSIQVNVDSEGNNILGDAANEPSIAVDLNDPSRMAIGWRQFDTVTNNFRQAGWGYTTNGGQTWTFPGVIEPGHFRSDPVMGFDAEGNFYYNSLTNEGGYQCKVFKSSDGGASWNAGVFAYGGDKQWMTIDRTSGIGQGNIYACWNQYYSICSGHFTRSTDGGQTFVGCPNVPGSPYWGTLAVGPDGELYVSGGGFIVAKSTTAQDPGAEPVQWDFSTTMSLGGSIEMSAGPNPGGLLGQAWIAVDHSDGFTRGNVYMLCSVAPSGADPLDIKFSRSTNGGVNWSPPVRVNDDPTDNGAWQWFGTMSVAPNGRIDAIWNDTRADPGGYDSELYYSYSEDAGVTWSVNEPLSPPFNPHLGWPDQNKLGDYYDMVSDNLGAHVAYAATFNGEQNVYYLRIGETASDAGTVKLDREKYACESTANIMVLDRGLNTDDGAVEFAIVDIDSDSETNIEQVTLTETSPASARFEGSIDLSTVDSSGVLWVSEGETVTVTYIDADNGQGGTNVEVTDTALVDCTAPVISNVLTSDIGPFEAFVTFDTDELTLGSVRYGASCTALTETASQSGYLTEHSVMLSGLDDNSTYFYAVDAEDEAGNPATDDNGGGCYTFATPDVPSYFTEEFGADNDLDNVSLIFMPNESFDYYRGCAEPISSLPTDPAGGTPLVWSNGTTDDGYATLTLSGGATVSLYGGDYSTFYPGTNGYITFTGGDTEYNESPTDHFNMPRISALFDDLNPSTGGTVTWRQLEDRAAVTWQNVPEYYSTGSNTFQIEMYFDGIIVISYLSISASDGMAGLSEGLGVPTGFLDTDLSGMGDCMIDCNDNGVPDDEDISNGTSNDCNENSIPDECDIADGTSKDCNSNEAPDECDIADGTSEDCNDNEAPDECDLADGTSQDCNGNEAPDECDIADGTSFDDNGNGVPDECELVLRPDPVGFDPDMWDNPPGDTSCMQDSDCHTAASTTPYCIPKQDGGFPGTCYASTNRYLSIRKNPDQTSASGRRISLSTGEAGPWWVGPPIYNPGLDMYFSSVVNVPAFAGMGAGAWVNGDWPDELHVKGCEIAPGTHSYWVQAVAFGDEGDEGLYSVVLDLRIQERWGDVISTCFFDQCLPPQGAVTQPDIDDVLAMVNAFQGVPNAPLWWMDIDPFFADGEPEGLPALIGDVLAVVNAFVGLPYTGNGPAGCAP